MSKTITLTVGERLAALKIFDAFKGSVTELSTIMDDVKQVAITNVEWEKAKREIIKGKNEAGQETQQWQWQEADESTWKKLTLAPETLAYLTKSIKDKTDVTVADLALISLSKKL
jgi:hypothetical protein